MIRMPAVAGTFYPGGPTELEALLRRCFEDPTYGPGSIPHLNSNGPRRIIGLICPHAGYIYSGYAAAKAYHALAEDGLPETIILVGPNHYGMGAPVSIQTEGTWKTPLGDVEIDSQTAKDLLAVSNYLSEGNLAHKREHSLEVQVPFLQFSLGSAFKIVPIVVGVLDAGAAQDLGNAFAAVLSHRNAIIVASTDFSHYIPHQIAFQKDHLAIKEIQSLNLDRFFEVILKKSITMCGVVPVGSLIAAANTIGNCHVDLLGYNTSGDIIGEKEEVVGYASLRVTRGE